MTLPSASMAEAWEALLSNDAALLDGVRAILQGLALAAAPFTRYDSGSLPVYAVGDRHALKLYPPHEVEHAAVEGGTLAFVHGRLPLPTPEVIATGVQDGWHWLLMSQLRGRRLIDVWPALTATERDRLAGDLGHAIAVLHGLDGALLAPLLPPWEDFVSRQRASAAERQRNGGLAAPWLDQIEAFLNRWMPPTRATHALLHTELMREHLMVERAATGWQLSGLFDFEPAMLGDPEYDFASFGLFVACGDGRFLRRALGAYGYPENALDAALQCRLMAFAILHRYSKLSWYLERLPPLGATTLEALARRWWPLDGVR